MEQLEYLLNTFVEQLVLIKIFVEEINFNSHWIVLLQPMHFDFTFLIRKEAADKRILNKQTIHPEFSE